MVQIMYCQPEAEGLEEGGAFAMQYNRYTKEALF